MTGFSNAITLDPHEEHFRTGSGCALAFFDALTNAPVKRDIKIGRGTHLMRLEATRIVLWRESVNFLGGEDAAAISA